MYNVVDVFVMSWYICPKAWVTFGIPLSLASGRIAQKVSGGFNVPSRPLLGQMSQLSLGDGIEPFTLPRAHIIITNPFY